MLLCMPPRTQSRNTTFLLLCTKDISICPRSVMSEGRQPAHVAARWSTRHTSALVGISVKKFCKKDNGQYHAHAKVRGDNLWVLLTAGTLAALCAIVEYSCRSEVRRPDYATASWSTRCTFYTGRIDRNRSKETHCVLTTQKHENVL